LNGLEQTNKSASAKESMNIKARPEITNMRDALTTEDGYNGSNIQQQSGSKVTVVQLSTTV
jgi:hypothetical protein